LETRDYLSWRANSSHLSHVAGACLLHLLFHDNLHHLAKEQITNGQEKRRRNVNEQAASRGRNTRGKRGETQPTSMGSSNGTVEG
jgi:hypothetical protein